MADHIKIRKTSGTFVVRTSGAIVAETSNAMELSEGDYPAVIYFPRSDVAMAVLEKTDHSTHCPHKGEASYFALVTPEGRIENAAWSYEDPTEAAKEIAGYLAFYGDKVTVEQI